MAFIVYVIQSKVDGRLYKGMTSDISTRLKEHNLGHNFSTSPYCPWELVYTKEFSDRHEAREWEKYLKSGSGRKYLKKIISGG